MSLYLLIPLAACIASAVFATAIMVRDAQNRASRIAATMIAGVSFWALCEILWNSRATADDARFFVRLSGIGWIFIGPLVLHAMREITGARSRWTDRESRVLYAIAAGFLLASLFTPWIHTGVVPTSWGWGYEIGWLHPVFLAFTAYCIVSSLVCGVRAYHTASPGERAQAMTVAVGIVVPFVIASATDSLLPLFGYQPLRLGTSAMTLFGATIAWSFYRFGYSLLAPGTFANEILEGPEPAPTEAEITWSKHIQPLFRAACAQCHMDGNQRGDYRVDTPTLLRKPGESKGAMPLVVPGEPEKSLLWLKLAVREPGIGDQMPLQQPPLDRHAVDLVYRWIKGGAKSR